MSSTRNDNRFARWNSLAKTQIQHLFTPDELQRYNERLVHSECFKYLHGLSDGIVISLTPVLNGVMKVTYEVSHKDFPNEHSSVLKDFEKRGNFTIQLSPGVMEEIDLKSSSNLPSQHRPSMS